MSGGFLPNWSQNQLSATFSNRTVDYSGSDLIVYDTHPGGTQYTTGNTTRPESDMADRFLSNSTLGNHLPYDSAIRAAIWGTGQTEVATFTGLQYSDKQLQSTSLQGLEHSDVNLYTVSPEISTEVPNQLQSLHNTEYGLDVSPTGSQNNISSSSQGSNRHRTTSPKNTIGNEDKYLLGLRDAGLSWKEITTNYNEKFTKKTREALQMRVRRNKENTKIWSENEINCLCEVKKKNPNSSWKDVANMVTARGVKAVSDRTCRSKWFKIRKNGDTA